MNKVFPAQFANVLGSFRYNFKSVLFDIYQEILLGGTTARYCLADFDHCWQNNKFIFFWARFTEQFSTCSNLKDAFRDLELPNQSEGQIVKSKGSNAASVF